MKWPGIDIIDDIDENSLMTVLTLKNWEYSLSVMTLILSVLLMTSIDGEVTSVLLLLMIVRSLVISFLDPLILNFLVSRFRFGSFLTYILVTFSFRFDITLHLTPFTFVHVWFLCTFGFPRSFVRWNPHTVYVRSSRSFCLVSTFRSRYVSHRYDLRSLFIHSCSHISGDFIHFCRFWSDLRYICCCLTRIVSDGKLTRKSTNRYSIIQ